MTVMNAIKSGESLVHPKPSISWVAGAAVGVVVLLLAVGIGTWLYGKGKAAVAGTSVKSKLSGLESQATKQLQGFL